jgi:hypothetical protein
LSARRSPPLLLAVLACCRPGAAVPSAPAPAQHVIDVPPVASVAPVPSAASARPPSFEAIVDRVYPLLTQGRLDEAQALAESAATTEPEPCYGPTLTRGEGGGLVVGTRVLVQLDARGHVVGHRLYEGCVLHADADLAVIQEDARVVIASRSGPELGALEGNEHYRTARVIVRESWILALSYTGDYLAYRRGGGALARGRHSGTWDGLDEDVGVSAHGSSFVVSADGRFTVTRGNGSRVKVTGCSGSLRAFVESGDGYVVHVGANGEATARGGTGADTRLCLVKRDGTTRRVVKLGHAICGMASAVPCEWELQAFVGRLVGFGSMRGKCKVIDALTGVDLPIVLPKGAYFEGGSPSSLFVCGDDGDRICASYAQADQQIAVSALTLDRGRLTTSPAAKREDAGEPSWCMVNGLPLPPAACASSVRPGGGRRPRSGGR